MPSKQVDDVEQAGRSARYLWLFSHSATESGPGPAEPGSSDCRARDFLPILFIDGSPSGIKRERGASAFMLNAAAAPATVSGESSVKVHWDWHPGKATAGADPQARRPAVSRKSRACAPGRGVQAST